MAKIIELKGKPSKLHNTNTAKSSIACTTTLESNVMKLLSNDIVELKSIPFEDVSKRFYKVVINFTSIKNDTSRQQFRDLLFSIFCREVPYKRASDRIYYVLRLAKFMSDLSGITEIPDKELKELFGRYCDENHYYKDCKKIIIACKNALLEIYDTRKGFDRDTWDKSVFQLPDERINKSSGKYTFYFRQIENVENREYAKLYIKYLLGNTEQALSTAINYFSHICRFCDFIYPQSILDVTDKDFRKYLDFKKDLSDDAYNHNISRIYGMYEYLAVKGIMKNPIPVNLGMCRKNERKACDEIVSEHVILQIFNHLHKAPFNYLLMYLINYCTGMRISDVCQLRTDCLYEDGKDGYYVRPYNCQKMQKAIMNLIPKALFELIQEQIKIINALDYEEEYLFPSEEKKNYPYNALTFRNNFKRLCNEWGVKNEDGTLYNYTTHSYRRTISTDLYQNYNVPIVTIQKAVLWHKEIQMTLSYVKRPEEFRKMKADKYFSKTGEAELSEWLKENLQNNILPNGVCGLAPKLGTCPAVDACLSCPHFMTSRKFLQIHKDQLATIKSRLVIYEANGWTPNIETAKRQIGELENIIQKLEEKEDVNANETIKVNTSTTNL